MDFAQMKTAILVSFLLLFQAAVAASEPPVAPPASPRADTRMDVKLVSEFSRVKPGAVFWIGLHQVIAEGWHTYWRNPGDSGQPLTVEWTLPEGFHVGAVNWPIPKRVPTGPFMSYGYEAEVLYLWELTVPESARPGDVVDIKADVLWLICKDACLIEEAEVRMALEITDAENVADPRWASTIHDAVEALPSAFPGEASFTVRQNTMTLALRPFPDADLTIGEIRFFPYAWGIIDHASLQTTEERSGEYFITVDQGALLSDAAESGEYLEGLVVSRVGDETAAYEVRAENRRK
jgi:thiol:disulfide interchange protein DsbD